MPLSKPPRHPRKPTGGGRARDAMPVHARLVDAAGDVVGGVARREEEWVAVLGGRVLATTESAGLAIAMLRHTATLLGDAGRPVRVDVAETLRDAATAEGLVVGKPLEEYLAFLEAERAERARDKSDGPSTPH